MHATSRPAFLHLLLGGVVLLSACAHERSGASLREAADAYLSSTPEDQRIVAPEWLARALASGRAGLAVIDIRERREYEVGHIAGAIHVPFKSATRPETLERLPGARPLVLVCKSGHTASMLNAIWNLLGIQSVTLKDGMRGWTAAALPLTTAERR